MARRSLFVVAGQRIGRGVVVDPEIRVKLRSGKPLRSARLICDCGTEYVSSLQALVGTKRNGSQRCLSCGCLRRERQVVAVVKHGMSRRANLHPLIKVWEGMIHRCESPNDAYYAAYGGRGISVCEAWHDPVMFAADIDRLLGPRPEGWTLDRINNDGNYEPGNVRWASADMQAANRRPARPRNRTAPIRSRTKPHELRTLICVHCGSEYRTLSGAQNLMFCSKTCKAAHRRASGVDDVVRTCHQCGGTFAVSRYSGQRHCSHPCATTCQHAGGCPAP